MIIYEQFPYKCFQIIPTPSCRNWRTPDILRLLADLYKIPLERLKPDFKQKKICLKPLPSLMYEITWENKEVYFYFHVPNPFADIFSKRFQMVWPNATIKETERSFPFQNPSIYELIYRKHDLFSLHDDHKDNIPLNSLLEAGKTIKEEEKASVFVLFEPLSLVAYQNNLKEVLEDLKKGNIPEKNLLMKNITRKTLLFTTDLIKDLVATLGDIIGFESSYTNNPTHSLNLNLLSNSTLKKPYQPGVKTCIWTFAESDINKRADIIARSLAMAFGDLTLDNELIPLKINNNKKVINIIKTRQIRSYSKWNGMSFSEAGKLIQIPGEDLIKEYPEIISQTKREVEVPNILTQGGIYLGEIVFRGKKQKVYLPINNHDELCLPHIVIGGMGCGKTKGFGSNFIVEAIKNDFGALVIDPAKKEISKEVYEVLPSDKIIEINFGNQLFALDWREINHSPRTKNRLANTLISFFNSTTDETGAQTARYLRASIMAMQTPRLSELIRIFEDDLYRAEVTEQLPDSFHKLTLQNFAKESEAKRRQITQPIYNRLDIILGDEYLSQCLETEEGLDFVELMSQKKAIIINIPKSELGPELVDFITNFLMTKIDLAMTLRPANKQFPFFVILDEPHQFLRSAKIWKSAVVESRKWRIGYIWLFHAWEQLPRNLAEIIKAAGPHYHLYTSSKATYKALLEEINPFTIEDALNTPRFHAINIIRANGITITPFLAKMAPPPSDHIRTPPL